MEDLQTGHDALLLSHGSMHWNKWGKENKTKELIRHLMAYFIRKYKSCNPKKIKTPTSLWNLCKQGRWRMVSPIVGFSRHIAQTSSLASVWQRKQNSMKYPINLQIWQTGAWSTKKKIIIIIIKYLTDSFNW